MMSKLTERRKLMKEEDKILKKVGTENPFRVPDDYFENLTSEVMSRLPEKRNLPFCKRNRQDGRK